MSLRWLSGTAGLALSLALHLAAGGALWLALRPDPVEQQSPPETRLAMETREIRESTAAEAQPDAAPAREDAPDPAALATGAIPTSRATPSAPSATPLPEAARPAEPLA
ncbi:hypothetical protein E0K89_021070, partial [Aquicoccus sp. SCR17]|nr:hypothetical protein [Carideicomes alvinocaridis]